MPIAAGANLAELASGLVQPTALAGRDGRRIGPGQNEGEWASGAEIRPPAAAMDNSPSRTVLRPSNFAVLSVSYIGMVFESSCFSGSSLPSALDRRLFGSPMGAPDYARGVIAQFLDGSPGGGAAEPETGMKVKKLI
jgi:hypothetical protein